MDMMQLFDRVNGDTPSCPLNNESQGTILSVLSSIKEFF